MNIEEYLADLPNKVWGETQAERIRHTEARGFFKQRLAHHAGEQNLFHAWAHAAGIYDIARQLREDSALLQAIRRGTVPESELQLARAVASEHAQAMTSALKERGTWIIVQLAHAYVHKELQLRWDWLATEMGRAWYAWLQGWITQQPRTVLFHYIPREQFGPPLKFQFESREDEPFEAMLTRFKEETAHFTRTAKAQYRRHKGLLRSDQDVERYVEWFFRLKVKKESARRVAMYAADGKRLQPAYERKDVVKYAGVAERWLELGFTMEKFENMLNTLHEHQFPPGEVTDRTNFPTSAPTQKSL